MKNKQQLYTDQYFEKGHWLLKIRQTVVAILSWIAVVIPITITSCALLGVKIKLFHKTFQLDIGRNEAKLLAVILLFAFVMVAIFTISMTLIQNRRRERLVEQWPTFNPIEQSRREEILEEFMSDHFGEAEFRHSVREYHVQPEQNLDTDTFQDLFQDKPGDSKIK